MAKAPAAAEWIHIDDLDVWAKNPRKQGPEAIDEGAASLRRFGFGAAVVAWRRAGARARVVAGHLRIKSTREILRTQPEHVFPGAPGPGFVPVRFMDFATEAEASAYALRDNNAIGAWDEGALVEVLSEIEAMGADLDGLGWDEKDLERMRNDMPIEEDPDVAHDKFYLSITGPQAQQAQVLAALTAALQGVEGVEIIGRS